MKNFIKLPKSILSIEEKLAITGLLMSAKNDGETITSVSHMEVLLTDLSKSNRKTQNALFTGLMNLNEKEIIKIENMPNKASDFFKVHIKIKDENFTILYYDEIQKIMGGCYKGALNRELFDYYSALASFYNNNSKVAYPSMEQLSKLTGLHIKTVQKYNKTLSELDIIHIENNGLISNEDGVQSLRNTYSRKEDSQLCKTEAESYRNKVAKAGGKLIERKSKKNHLANAEEKKDNYIPIDEIKGFGITDINIQPFYYELCEFSCDEFFEYGRMKSFEDLKAECNRILEENKNIEVYDHYILQ